MSINILIMFGNNPIKKTSQVRKRTA